MWATLVPINIRLSNWSMGAGSNYSAGEEGCIPRSVLGCVIALSRIGLSNWSIQVRVGRRMYFKRYMWLCHSCSNEWERVGACGLRLNLYT